MDSPEGLEDIPANALPWLTAVTIWTCATLEAHLIGGDWDVVAEAYDAMVYEHNRFASAFIAASSGAATELDYYDGGNHG